MAQIPLSHTKAVISLPGLEQEGSSGQSEWRWRLHKTPDDVFETLPEKAVFVPSQQQNSST
jgi:hypothetical protein